MFEYFIYHYGTQIIAAILCAIFGCLGYAIKQLAVKYINDDTKRAIARVAAQFVEQRAVVGHDDACNGAVGGHGHVRVQITVLRVIHEGQFGEKAVDERASFWRSGQTEGDLLADGHDDAAGYAGSVGRCGGTYANCLHVRSDSG